jgi:putative ABC transport system permease protein
VFASISKAYDDVAVQIPRDTARTLLKARGDHRLVVLLDHTEQTSDTAFALARRLEIARYEVIPWYALADFYNKTAELFAKQTAVVKLIIAVIIVLGISNTMMMSVMERTGEIGTGMALGVTRTRILSQFLTEGAVLGVIGGLIGVVAGVLAALAASAIGIPMPPPPGQSWGYTGEMRLTAPMLAEAFLLAVGTALVASAYPAWKASRMNVVDALRHNA